MYGTFYNTEWGDLPQEYHHATVENRRSSVLSLYAYAIQEFSTKKSENQNNPAISNRIGFTIIKQLPTAALSLRTNI